MSVTAIKTPDQFTEAINKPSITVVDFWAEWCGPCKMVAPKYAELAEKYPTATFIKVEIDELENLPEVETIRSMPTFRVYEAGVQKGEVIGTNIAKLEGLLEGFVGGAAATTA
ncbi:Cytoplasmic thioredoxin isoenzyme 2 [Rhizoclosmatium hyalinum]|nr:Cytoplasmic thioredoxin isoenzyme 2 [Rhizoclosmatium hyalinum]